MHYEFEPTYLFTQSAKLNSFNKEKHACENSSMRIQMQSIYGEGGGGFYVSYSHAIR